MKNGKTEIPLTSFIDFVCKSGSPKMTCAKRIKLQLDEPYNVVTDFYKRFRDAVQELHRKGINKKELSKLIGGVPDGKETNYKEMELGYKKFLGNKVVTWFQPSRQNWIQGNLSVTENPEIGLKWDDKKYVIKLNLNSDKLTKDKISSIIALMKDALLEKDCFYSLLEVRRGKLYLYEENMHELMPMVKAEAQALELILSQI